jgi:Fe-S cluster assembly iron-binding protein IscA
MLSITPRAAHAIRAIVAATRSPSGSGLRISISERRNGRIRRGLALDVRPRPDADDTVVERAGVQVFLDPQAARALAAKALDADLGRGQVSFAIFDAS